MLTVVKVFVKYRYECFNRRWIRFMGVKYGVLRRLPYLTQPVAVQHICFFALQSFDYF